MEIRTSVAEDGTVHKHYVFAPGEVAVKTGPITGLVTLDGGTTVNVNEEYVAVADQAQADELAHKIGQHYEANGHPDDIDEDPETGEPVQRDFVYVAPETEPTKTSKGN